MKEELQYPFPMLGKTSREYHNPFFFLNSGYILVTLLKSWFTFKVIQKSQGNQWISRYLLYYLIISSIFFKFITFFPGKGMVNVFHKW